MTKKPTYEELEKRIQELEVTESKLKFSQEKLRESEERFALAVKGSNLGLWDWNIRTGDLAYSEHWADMLEYRINELEPNISTFESFLHPADKDRVMESLIKSFKDDDFEYNEEFRMKTRSGGWRWINSRGKVVARDTEKKALRMVGTNTDISKQKQVEEALKKSEERYRLLAENVTDIIWTMDMKMNFTYYSPSITRLQGFTVEEALARSAEESMTPASFDTIIKAMVEELEIYNKEQKPLDRSRKVEVELFCKDGSTIWAEVEASFIYDANGQPESIIGVTRDITERKQADEALKKSEKKYRLLAENANDLIWTTDLNLKINYTSPSIKSLRGYTPEEVINQKIEDILTPDSLEYAIKTFVKVFEQLENGIEVDDPYTLESECYCKDGSTIWVENKISSLEDSEGEAIGLFGISRDITERRRTEQRLLRSEKLASLGNMLAGVAHEISTPLSVSLISASYLNDATHEFSELFNSDGVDRAKVKRYVHKATEASSMILSNLGRSVDLLDSFKQVAVDQIVEERRNFNLRINIEDTLKSLSPKYTRTAHTIRVECPENIEIYSYPGAFSQIITNLIINSLPHGFEGVEKGEIVLTADKKENLLCFTFRDTGKGMNKATLNKLFDPFFTTTRSKGGVGLGMHIVHNLVFQTLKGHIECKSSLGKGTEFLIEIPLSDAVEY